MKNQKGSGGLRKLGRDKEKCKQYLAMHTREMNKVKRVLKSSGILEAQKYAQLNNVTTYLSKILEGYNG